MEKRRLAQLGFWYCRRGSELHPLEIFLTFCVSQPEYRRSSQLRNASTFWGKKKKEQWMKKKELVCFFLGRRLEAVVFNWEWFCSPGNVWQHLEIFGVMTLRVGKPYRHLLCRGQQCCSGFCSAQGSSPRQRINWPKYQKCGGRKILLWMVQAGTSELWPCLPNPDHHLFL